MGEVAEFQGRLAGTTAAAEIQAWHLSEYLRGNLHAPYPGPCNATILKVHGLQLAAVGIADADPAAGMSEVALEDPEFGVYQKCVIQGDRLVGVVMAGDTSEFPRYRDLVAGGVELGELRRRLLRGSGPPPLEGRLVCSCNQVGTSTIQRSISRRRQAGDCTLAAVCAESRAGTSCGSCRPEVQALIKGEGG